MKRACVPQRRRRLGWMLSRAKTESGGCGSPRVGRNSPARRWIPFHANTTGLPIVRLRPPDSFRRCRLLPRGSSRRRAKYGSYLVDPASSHMLVSKIKPCMSKYKQLYTVKLRMAH